METAVTSALNARPSPDPRDTASAALAVMYARLLDEPAPAAKYADALRWLEYVGDPEQGADRNVQRHVKTIMTALAEHSVSSDLGPKLQTTLDALRLTPKSRAGKGAQDDPTPGNPRRDELRARREALRARRDRQRYPEDLDPASP